MTTQNMRLLLVAAIIICNCITWTASGHHFTQNFHGLHSRYRRQAPGLFLASSFVIPTKDGENETEGWDEWGEVSPCSRTCGGGVASQKRICLKIGQDGKPTCRGGDTKYFSCQTQDCPAGSKDFRAEQCAAFNDQDFKGSKYDWVPYNKSTNPCELNCTPRGMRFYYKHKDKVIDGTKCTDDSFDVCVDGKCQPVGCDMMLGSSAREDKCRICRGNGTNCHTNTGIIDTRTLDLVTGYNDILLIPAGATTIVIEQLKPSSNYLALRNQHGTFYLNGHYKIDFSRNMMIAGALCSYESSHIGVHTLDKIKCLGPIEEALYLSVLNVEGFMDIKYEYSVLSELDPGSNNQYKWVHTEFNLCNASCGRGIQTRNVTCRRSEDLEIVDDTLCDDHLKPATSQNCNTTCSTYWIQGSWGPCSKRCGKDGIKIREVQCHMMDDNGILFLVDDKECFDLQEPKPPVSEVCNTDVPCPTWFVDEWKPCDKQCDEGKQTRVVECHVRNDNRSQILEDKECESVKPETEKTCMLSVCDGVEWFSSNWFGCDTCLSTVRTRQVKCLSHELYSFKPKVYDDHFCGQIPKPITEEQCDKDKLPKCAGQWFATEWSKCSVECGQGVQTRTVFCGIHDGNNLSSIIQVDEAECNPHTKYNSTKSCEVPKDKCLPQWFSSDRSKFTKVACLLRDHASFACPDESPSDTNRLCIDHTCPVPDLCTLPADVGTCSQYRTNWYYDTSVKSCRTFYYGGCGGNSNNFATQAACQNACNEPTTNTVKPQTPPATQSPPDRRHDIHTTVCSLPKDVGPGTDFKPFWFYDMSYGACSYFWYGGVEGNGNKFTTQAECENTCIHPDPKDACKLPSVTGPCDNTLERWYYNSTVEQCVPFYYGGCLGNSNNFDTRELCQKQCEIDRTTVVCSLPKDVGPGTDFKPFWFYDMSYGACSYFWYGGVEGNGNKFTTQAECEDTCIHPDPKDACKLPSVTGPCDNTLERWYYNSTVEQCVPFYYGGCLGNSNNFDTRELCQKQCEIDRTTVDEAVIVSTEESDYPEASDQPYRNK